VGNSLGQFGVSTNGFNGGFNGSGLGNQDNGIVATGTNLGNGGLSAHTPYAQSGLEITLSFTNSTDFSASNVSISGVKLLFGTSGQGVIGGTPGTTTFSATPEPATAVSGVIAVFMGLFYARRRRRLSA
jgi:hypothetical protein